ncbi:MAG: NAD(P)/FAD-dependent oxidoreductase [Sediminibacterium sp.]
MNTIELQVSPAQSADLKFIEEKIQINLNLSPLSFKWRIDKRSIDARKRNAIVILRISVIASNEEFPSVHQRQFKQELIGSAIIIGAGPAGLFAALRLLELGIKPIILERGKDVRARRRDLVEITRNGIVNEDSNYCYGEGGAGTYSDGKLYTRSTKKGSVVRILETLVQFGANENILTESHPHVGTNKLPQIIANMRESILANGGEIHFEERVVDFNLGSDSIHEVKTAKGKSFQADSILLATGHSARDIFELLHAKNIALEAKPFAIGVRIEHDQRTIDKLQYKCDDRGEFLPPASYSIVTQVNDHGVYSFCMCPGGIVAPCATSQEEIVTNGWSPSKRNNPWANSGIVVEVKLSDLENLNYSGPLAGLHLQQDIEKKAYELGGANQFAPAQRATDFIYNKKSTTLPDSSYSPGITSVNLRDLFPKFISECLIGALQHFNTKMPNFAGPNALLLAPETRTSSPVRIPRDKELLNHPDIKNLFPCGEGAGYAGGIVSAAIDGERCADAISAFISKATSESM